MEGLFQKHTFTSGENTGGHLPFSMKASATYTTSFIRFFTILTIDKCISLSSSLYLWKWLWHIKNIFIVIIGLQQSENILFKLAGFN